MKKKFIFLIIMIALISLTGCSLSLAEHRSIEDLLVIETVGFDRYQRGVRVSLASAALSGENGKSDAPVRLTAVGSSITAAIERLSAHATGKTLFNAHTKDILIGEEAAHEGIESYILYICRSPDMRLGVPVFIVRGATAVTAVNAGDDQEGISELLASLVDRLDNRGGGHVIPAGEIYRNVKRYGGSLVSAIQCTQKKSTGCEVDIYGYAVLDGWRLSAFIPRDEMLAVDFLTNSVDISILSADSADNTSVSYEVSSGKCDFNPVWERSGKLERLDINVAVSASVLELDENTHYDSDELTCLLENAVSSQITSVLRLSRELSVDFLGLADIIEASSPYDFRKLPASFSSLLPELDCRVSVTGKLDHSNDLKEA